MSPKPDRLERLADLMEEVGQAVEAGEILDSSALAARFDLDAGDVAHCIRAMQAIDMSLDEDTTNVDELRPPQLPADYEVRGELGRGGMGIVYRVHQKSLDREVALKVLRPGDLILGGAIQRFEREARSLARLRHRHIVSVHEVGHADGFVYFTMDLVEGRTLEDLVADRKITATQTVRLLRQIGAAIGYAHSQGIVHRDLKPANILVNESGDAFVVDFGLAFDVGNAGASATLSGQLIGTPAYMSPEQVRGDREHIGEAADIYALGAVLYQCLTGRAPFAGLSLAHLMQAVLEEAPQPPRKINPSTPRALEVICAKAMAKRAQDRYPTAQAFVDDLERFAGGQMILARPPSKASRVAHLLWNQRRQISAVIATALLAFALAWFWILPRMLGKDMIALGDELHEAGNNTGAMTAYRAALAEQDLAAVDPAILAGFLASIHEEAGRLMLTAGPKDEIEVLLEEAGRCFPSEKWNSNYHAFSKSTSPLAFEWLRHQALRGERVIDRFGLASLIQPRIVEAWLRDPAHETDLILFAGALAGRGFSDRLVEAIPGRSGRVLVGRLFESWEHLPASIRETLSETLRSAPAFTWKQLLGERDDRLEDKLIDVLADASRPEATRLLAFDLLGAISDRYPRRGKYPGRVGVYVTSMRNEDLRHVAVVRNATRGLSESEAYRKRLELYAQFLPEKARSREEERTSPAHYLLEDWYGSHTGIRIKSKAEWAAWWAKHVDEDPRSWLLHALGWDEDPSVLTGERILAEYGKYVGTKKRLPRGARLQDCMHHLLELTTDPDSVPVLLSQYGRDHGFAMWSTALDFAPIGIQHVRLACFGFKDGAPEPLLLWQERVAIAPNKTHQVSVQTPHSLDYLSLRFQVRECMSRHETWNGAGPHFARVLHLNGVVSLIWDGRAIRGNADIRDAVQPSPWNGHSGQGFYGGTLTPGRVSFLHRSTHYSDDSGHVLRLLPVALMEDDSTTPGTWGIEEWQAAVRETLHGQAGDGAAILPNLLWGLEVFPIPDSSIAEVRQAVGLLPDDVKYDSTMTRLMAGDRAALKEVDQLHGDVRHGLAESLARLALSTTAPEIRAFALDRLKSVNLPPAIAHTLARAAGLGEFQPPEWLEERITEVGKPTPWGRLDTESWIALSLLATGLFGGLAGLCFWRRSRRGRQIFALVVAVTAGFLANTRLDYGAHQLVPTWISFGILAMAVWVLFWRTTRNGLWTLCPLWWTGYALADLVMRITMEQTAPGWAFVVGVVLFVIAFIQATNSATPTRRRSRP